MNINHRDSFQKPFLLQHGVDWLHPSLLDALWYRLISAEFLMSHQISGYTWYFATSVPCLCKTTRGFLKSRKETIKDVLRKLAIDKTPLCHIPYTLRVYKGSFFRTHPDMYSMTLRALFKHVKLHGMMLHVQQFFEHLGFQVTMAGGMAAMLQYRHWCKDATSNLKKSPLQMKFDPWQPSDVDIFVGQSYSLSTETQSKLADDLKSALENTCEGKFDVEYTGYSDDYKEDPRQVTIQDPIVFFEHLFDKLGLSENSRMIMDSIINSTSCLKENEKGPDQFYSIEGTWRLNGPFNINLIWTKLLPEKVGARVDYAQSIVDSFDMSQCAVSARAIPTSPYWQFLNSADTYQALKNRQLKVRKGMFETEQSAKKITERILKYMRYGFAYACT